jgi:hypothetical protein
VLPRSRRWSRKKPELELPGYALLSTYGQLLSKLEVATLILNGSAASRP